jgi:lipopolysaccharide cholinephosphotransferase
MYIILIILVILIIITVLINISVQWTGDIPFKWKNCFKNILIKGKHLILNKPFNTKIAQENLELFSDILNKANIPFWLSEGTALGARREGNFILHDDDIDIGIWIQYREQFKQILPELIKAGFTIDFEVYNNTIIWISRKGVKIDVDFTGKNIICVACKTSTAQCSTCNKMLKYLQKLEYIDFLGKKYLCPGEDYLEYLYGKDWKIPQKQQFNKLLYLF